MAKANRIQFTDGHFAYNPTYSPQDVMADAPERILTMAEKQMAHRFECEKKIIDSRIRESRIGQIMAFIIAIFSIGIVCFLGYKGHDWLAGSITAIIVGLASIFLFKKSKVRIITWANAINLNVNAFISFFKFIFLNNNIPT